MQSGSTRSASLTVSRRCLLGLLLLALISTSLPLISASLLIQLLKRCGAKLLNALRDFVGNRSLVGIGDALVELTCTETAPVLSSIVTLISTSLLAPIEMGAPDEPWKITVPLAVLRVKYAWPFPDGR